MMCWLEWLFPLHRLLRLGLDVQPAAGAGDGHRGGAGALAGGGGAGVRGLHAAVPPDGHVPSAGPAHFAAPDLGAVLHSGAGRAVDASVRADPLRLPGRGVRHAVLRQPVAALGTPARGGQALLNRHAGRAAWLALASFRTWLFVLPLWMALWLIVPLLGNQTAAEVSMGVGMLLFAGSAVAAMTQSVRLIQVRLDGPWCLACGYELTGLTSPRCPSAARRSTRPSSIRSSSRCRHRKARRPMGGGSRDAIPRMALPDS